jgi:hypothetical protein
MTNNFSAVGTKRKHFELLDDESTSLRLKRARTVPTEDMMVIGLVPLMTITPSPLKYAPNQDLVHQVKRIITSGTKTQKEVAKECNLSQTKMSQFMNLSPRVKGWESVEAKVIAWLKKTVRSQRASHLLETDYSIPQSCVFTSQEPKTEDFTATVLLQNTSNPWYFTPATNQLTAPERDLGPTHPCSNNTSNYNSDEVSNTSSDRSGVEISAEDLFHDPKTYSDVYGSEKVRHAPSGGIQPRLYLLSSHNNSGFYNEFAWDNFSIVQALDSPT